MPIVPWRGQAAWMRQRKSCAASISLGTLKLVTLQPCGLTPLNTCRIVPSFSAGIDRLEDHEHGPFALGVKKVLQRGEFFELLVHFRNSRGFVFEMAGVVRGFFSQLDFFAGANEVRRIDHGCILDDPFKINAVNREWLIAVAKEEAPLVHAGLGIERSRNVQHDSD